MNVRIKLTRAVVPSALFLVLAGCDAHVYEMKAASEGEIYILNRYTGALEKTINGKMTTVHTLAASSRTTGSCESDYPSAAVRFSVNYRPLAGKIYYRIRIYPSSPTGKSILVSKWNNYLDEIGTQSSSLSVMMNLRFATPDGFNVDEHAISLGSMTSVVDKQGVSHFREAQGSADLQREIFEAVASCSVAIRNLPSAMEDLFEPVAESVAKTRAP